MRCSYDYIPFVFDFQDRPVILSPHQRFYNLPRLREYARVVSRTFESESTMVYFFRVRPGSADVSLFRFDEDMKVVRCPVTSAIIWFLVSALQHGYSDVLMD